MANRKDNKGRVLYKGEMQQNDGRYRYTYTDTLKKRRCVYAKSLIELRELEKDISNKLSMGIITNNDTMQDAFNRLMALKCNIKESTRDHYTMLWNKYVKESVLYLLKPRDIKQEMIKKHYAELIKQGYSSGTIHNINILLNAIFEMLIENDEMHKNPCKNALKDIKNDKKSKVPLTQEQVKALLEFCKSSASYHIYAPMIQLQIESCLRCGELFGLTWNDIDFKNNLITVDHQMNYSHYTFKHSISTPKTKSSIRQIPITPSMKKALIEQKKLNLALGKNGNYTVDGYSNFVFTNRNSIPCRTDNYNLALKHIVDAYNKANKGNELHHISSHVLRHTGCTLYASKGIDIKALQDIMGHSDARTTLNIYNHASTERTKRELEKIKLDLLASGE